MNKESFSVKKIENEIPEIPNEQVSKEEGEIYEKMRELFGQLEELDEAERARRLEGIEEMIEKYKQEKREELFGFKKSKR